MQEPSWVAQLDQMLAATVDLTKAVAASYHGLIEQEVPDDAATVLTANFQACLLAGNGTEE